jgi:protein SCO1/2
MASSSIIAFAGMFGALVLAVARPALAVAQPAVPVPAPAASDKPAAPDEEILAPPPTYQGSGVTVDERLGGRVPLDAVFRTQDGTLVTLGDVVRRARAETIDSGLERSKDRNLPTARAPLAGDLPVILTFNYSDCPMLCSLQLNGLTAALPKVGEPGPSLFRASSRASGGAAPGSPQESRDMVFRVGAQFRIVTIALDPNETLAKAQAMRERYLARLPEDQRAAARDGWTFLVAATLGDATAIQRVADAVGFRYTYIKDRAEWAHPAALILLSASGVVTRYLHGIEFDPQVMRESIYKAGIAEPAAAVGFMIRCYHYDPGANSHARAGVMALRIGAAGFVVLLFAALGVMHLVRRSNARGRPPARPAAPNGAAPNGVT